MTFSEITPDDLALKRVKEICEAMALRSGPDYAAKLETMANLYLVTSQAAYVAERQDDPLMIHMLNAIGTLMVGTLPTLAGVAQNDFITVAKAATNDSQDVQRVLRRKLGL